LLFGASPKTLPERVIIVVFPAVVTAIELNEQTSGWPQT